MLMVLVCVKDCGEPLFLRANTSRYNKSSIRRIRNSIAICGHALDSTEVENQIVIVVNKYFTFLIGTRTILGSVT